MHEAAFQDRMKDLAEDHRHERYGLGADKAQALLVELRGEDEEVDPLMLGWTRYHLVRHLHAAERWQAAWEALVEDEVAPWSVSAEVAGWMYSVGAEVAMHLDQAEDVLTMSMKSVEYRMKGEDPGAALMSAANGCALLETLDAEPLNAPLAWFLIQHGEAVGPAPLLHGFQHAADGLAASPEPDPTLAALVIERMETLRQAEVGDDMEGGQVLAQTLGRIEGSGWYRSTVDPDERRRLEHIDRLWEAADQGDLRALLSEAEGPPRLPPDTPRWLRPSLPTALMAAAAAGRPSAVRALLDLGADPEFENPQRRTALLIAADQGQAECVRVLAEAGANVDRIGVYGQTALHCAAWQDHAATLRVLIERGAQLETRDMTGATALALAASEDVPEIIQILLAAGANPDTRNDEGWSPVEVAEAEGLDEVAALLRGARLEAGTSSPDEGCEPPSI